MKAIEIIGRALRLIGAVDASEAIDANSAQDALSTLNVMLAEWSEADIGQPDVSLGLQSDIDSIADADAYACQLAMRIAPEYGLPISGDIAAMAEQAMNRLRLRYFTQGEVSLLELPTATEPFNILVG